MRRLDTPGRSQVFAENGIVATSHPLASSTAISILREGGSAIDAAIAASMVLSVVEPQMTGIGGDCFAIIHDPNEGGIHAINGSGRSSAKADLDWFLENNITKIADNGVHSITVPGALKAFDEMHQKFGKLEWTRLFKDAISTARNGFAVTPRVAFDWARNDETLLRDEGSAQHLLINGRVPELGERMKFDALANTLEKISETGIAPFYEGEFAAEIASVIAGKGGLLDENDLANVTSDWVTPISTEFAGHDVLEIPPNGQGMVTLIMMNLMEILDVHSYAPDSAERYHLEIEAGRVAYAVRDAMLADPEHMTVPVEELISKEYAQKLVGQISKLKRNDTIVLPDIPSSDTVYLTVADKDGQIVSLIYSVFTDFGSKIVTPNSGIVLQSRGACFNLTPGHPNAIGPSKRPLQTIIPAMAMQRGKPSYSFGVMGGAYQPMGQSHVFANLEKYGFDPQTALDHPRLFWGKDGVLDAESGLSRAVLGGLEARGHQLRQAAIPIGGGQIIKVDPSGFYCAGSDPRKDGFAIGY